MPRHRLVELISEETNPPRKLTSCEPRLKGSAKVAKEAKVAKVAVAKAAKERGECPPCPAPSSGWRPALVAKSLVIPTICHMVVTGLPPTVLVIVEYTTA